MAEMTILALQAIAGDVEFATNRLGIGNLLEIRASWASGSGLERLGFEMEMDEATLLPVSAPSLVDVE